ncbi:hypothetical protein F7725_002971 [Dissostichus mawsoni]|uniref:N-acetylglucosamine-6-phosphate deacetylase n=1 Tax=Dissostichus mawsoni TaxID=36200 RepID=A0A7J5Y9Q0_DISMA|nr:hypothetical protein F7725_002971 [Dissostichus mawsoni]
MPSNKSVSDAPITQFINCRILRDHCLQREDLWVRDGKILDPEKLFFDEHGYADKQHHRPGFIDVQINGGYGIDFSQACDDVGSGVSLVAKKILEHGVTSFCPTLVTSPPHVYHKVLPQVKVHDGGAHGAGVLGFHLEGPFISLEKKGAHPEQFLRTFSSGGFRDLMETYGGLDSVAMVTLAPELDGSQSVIRDLCQKGITVSLGHSVANMSQAEEAVQHGASFITHLFNAMLPVPAGRTVYYGMIADGIHTNPAALRIAHRAHPRVGLVLVTDAITAMGLPPGRHTLGQLVIEIQGLHAYVAGCSVEEALEAASLHPAQLLGLSHRKGNLDFGSDADLVLLDDTLNVKATFISGEEVWRK